MLVVHHLSLGEIRWDLSKLKDSSMRALNTNQPKASQNISTEENGSLDFLFFFFFFIFFFFFFEREFQSMAFVPDNSFLSSNQDTNQFLV